MAASKRKRISVWVERQLWATSGGHCCNPDCENPELIKLFEDGEITTIQEIAHIIAHSPDGPRSRESADFTDRDSFENLILLCPTCHKVVDNVPDHYPAELLLQWKKERIERVNAAFNMPVYEQSSDVYQALKQLEVRNREIYRNLAARLAVLKEAMPLLDPISRVVTQDEIDELEQAIVDLPVHEEAYRQRIKERYAEEASYYVPLVGETTETTHPLTERRSKAPRSTRRVRMRVDAEYREWITAGRGIERVILKSLREGVDNYPCVVLLGDPGSGKTTALENIAYQFADEPDILPLPLRLSEFQPGMLLDEFILLGWGGTLDANHWGAAELAENLNGYLEEGKLFLLFDALNEMPKEEYSKRAQELRRFIHQWTSKGNRFMVTCRVLDYREELSGFQRIEVQPLNNIQIQQFLMNELHADWINLWQVLVENGEDERLVFFVKGLKDGWLSPWEVMDYSGEGERRLLEMARNPYLLTMMIDVYVEEGYLDSNRAALMTRFTQILLEWAKEKTPSDQRLDAGVQSESLSALAFEMQIRTGSGSVVKSDLAKTVMPRQVQSAPNWGLVPSPPDQILELAVKANIIEMPVDRSSVRFYHQFLQEYFAARQMLKRDIETLTYLWRWPWLEKDMPLWDRPKDNRDPLPPPPPTGWEETTILASGLAAENEDQLVRALIRVNPVLAGRCLYEGQAKVDKTIRKSVIDHLLATISNSEVALRVRIAAGEILGYLGDPRLWEMVTVDAGEFLMGSDEENIYETPRHKLFLPNYQFSKYPVTNAEYRRFVEARGYQDKRWWTEAGWNWKNEKEQPRYWKYNRYNKPNQPVVGIGWYECVAYCHWLCAETGLQYRLPTEAEWEKAARGVDGWKYPWGNEFESDRLNSSEGAQTVQAITPVGIYPTGVSPSGVMDCAGNIWEWCATKWKKAYPYSVLEDEWTQDYLEGEKVRVIRGGVFYGKRSCMYCAYRFWEFPNVGHNYIGFRVVCSSANSLS